MTFPSGLKSIEFAPFVPVDQARDGAGNVWQSEEADPYWQGKGTTGLLNFDRWQDWDGFMLDAMVNRRVIEFVDPIYRLPGAYRATGVLPGGFSGTASLVDLDDPLNPVVANMPIGMQLRRGDRIGFANADNKTLHVITASLTVSSISVQAIPVLPPVLSNVFDTGDDVVLKDAVLRLNIEPNSWSAPRIARQDSVGTFSVIEAGIVG